MKKTLIFLLSVIVIIALLSTYCLCFRGTKNLKIKTQSGQFYTYRVELARTPEEQQKGLMNRKELAPNTGMIFLFEQPRVAHMWMKDTLIPLDMLFFNKSGQVVHVHHHAIPQDETVISSIRPVSGVLEINAGEAKKYNINYGSKLDLSNIK